MNTNTLLRRSLEETSLAQTSTKAHQSQLIKVIQVTLIDTHLPHNP